MGGASLVRKVAQAIGRQKRLTIGLWSLVGLAWGAGITVDALNLPEHIFADCRTVALAATIAALNSLVVARLDTVNERLGKAYEAMMDLRREQPDPALTPQPWPRLRSVGADDEPALRNGHGGNPR